MDPKHFHSEMFLTQKHLRFQLAEVNFFHSVGWPNVSSVDSPFLFFISHNHRSDSKETLTYISWSGKCGSDNTININLYFSFSYSSRNLINTVSSTRSELINTKKHRVNCRVIREHVMNTLLCSMIKQCASWAIHLPGTAAHPSELWIASSKEPVFSFQSISQNGSKNMKDQWTTKYQWKSPYQWALLSVSEIIITWCFLSSLNTSNLSVYQKGGHSNSLSKTGSIKVMLRYNRVH